MVREHLECPICSEEFGMQTRIFGCSQDHWICEACAADERLAECPICRESFRSRPPMRKFTVEKIAGIVMRNRDGKFESAEMA